MSVVGCYGKDQRGSVDAVLVSCYYVVFETALHEDKVLSAQYHSKPVPKGVRLYQQIESSRVFALERY